MRAEAATVGRVEGDEFLVICEDVNEQSAVALGRRLGGGGAPPDRGGRCAAPAVGEHWDRAQHERPSEPDVLVRTADAAAYEAKRSSKDVQLVPG